MKRKKKPKLFNPKFEPAEAFENLRTLARKVLLVPKSEYEKREAQWRQNRDRPKTAN